MSEHEHSYTIWDGDESDADGTVYDIWKCRCGESRRVPR